MGEFDYFVPDIGYFIYRKCHPGWIIEKSVIDFHDLSYVIEGSGTYWVNGAETHVRAGDIIYILPGSTREAVSSPTEPMELFAMNFKLLGNSVSDNESCLPFQLISHIGLDSRLIYLFKQLTRIWVEKDDLYIIEARAAAMRIFGELLRRLHQQRPASALDIRVEKIKDYINENFNSRLTLKQLAALVGLNDVYLGALFKNTVGISINAYINKIRVNHAADILITEKTTISEAAYQCGFSDAFYFCKVFKKQKGYPPSEISKHGILA